MWDPRKNVSEKWAARCGQESQACQARQGRSRGDLQGLRQAPAAKSRLAAVPVPADPALRVLPGSDEGCLRLGPSSACRKQLQTPNWPGLGSHSAMQPDAAAPKGDQQRHTEPSQRGHRLEVGTSLVLSRPGDPARP